MIELKVCHLIQSNLALDICNVQSGNTLAVFAEESLTQASKSTLLWMDEKASCPCLNTRDTCIPMHVLLAWGEPDRAPHGTENDFAVCLYMWYICHSVNCTKSN